MIENIQLEDGEEIKPIGFAEGYYITNFGRVFSTVQGFVKELSPFLDGKKNYWMIRLNNRRYLLHRLVAQLFIPNPKNLPEVNHKDKNKQNPKAENLEWCTRKDNLNDSYSTMSPTRNFRTCKLYNNGELVGEFQSISKACRYAKKHFGASESSLSKYLHWGAIEIVPDNKTGKYDNSKCSFQTVQNRHPIRIYKNGYFVKEVKSFPEVSKYFQTELNIYILPSTLHYRCKKGIVFEGYLLRKI